MKKFYLSLLLGVLASAVSFAQSATVCNVNAGPDQTICVPNCATLTATFTPTNQTGSYTLSQIPYAPDPYNVGTLVALTDDSWSNAINIPFPFCFYGSVYTQCIIGSNGVISFNLANAGGYCTWPIPNTPVPTNAAGTPINAVMGPWHDMNPSVGGTVRYTTYGTTPCRRFVISWNAVPMYSCGTPSTQQIVLYETTNIIENYIQTKPLCSSWNSGRAIQAIQNNAGTMATVVPGRNTPTQWNANNDARRYTPSGANTYAINWINNTTMASVGTTATVSVCPSQTTTYTAQLTYTNCNGQQVTQSDQVVVNVSGLAMTPMANVQICQGGSTPLNGTTPNAVSYSWSPGTGLSSTTSPTPTASPTVTTTYTLTATDAGGCQGTATVQVTVTPMNTANAGVDDSICSGIPTQLNASGGVSYSWNNDPSLSATNVSNPNANPSTTTTYTVTVTDANGCIGTDQVTVYVAPQPLTMNSTGLPANCNGVCDGQGIVIPNGGFAPYSYQWSSGGSGPSEPNLCAGSYTIIVTDDIGCTSQQTVTVTQPPAIVLATNTTSANCGLNDGSATVNANGGTPPYTYLWSSGGTGQTETNLAPGTYTVTVTDFNGCTMQAQANVPNTPGVTAQISAFADVTCNGACNGSIDGFGSNGTAPYNYAWSNGANTQSIGNLCPGTYTLTVTDANGCVSTNTASVTEPPVLTVAPPAGSPTICIGQSTPLSATGNGGTPTYTYDWMPGSMTGSPVTVSPTTTTTYTVIATDANGCVSAPATVTVIVNPPLNVVPAGNFTICPGGSTQISAVGNGGDGNLTYTWMPGNMNGANQTVTPATTTTYTVTLTDGCGTPSATGTVTITVQPPQNVTFAATSATTGCAVLCVSFQNNTTSAATMVWDFGDNSTSTASTPSHCYAVPGSYDITLTVTDVNGCVASSTLPNYVTVYPDPVANFGASTFETTALSPNISFYDQSLSAVTWNWEFGDPLGGTSTQQNPSYMYSDTGYYMVELTVTNSFGCVDSIEYPVHIKEDYAIYVPNTFTPNGDGLNELFFPQGIGIDPDRFEMLIFDRWGNLIFKTTDLSKGWDGKVQGHPNIAQIDTYVWKITTYDPDGSRRRYIGHVNLIR